MKQYYYKLTTSILLSAISLLFLSLLTSRNLAAQDPINPLKPENGLDAFDIFPPVNDNASLDSSNAASTTSEASTAVNNSNESKGKNPNAIENSFPTTNIKEAKTAESSIGNIDQKYKRNISVLELEEYIANNRFAKESGIEERAVLVRVYERMVLALCFPPLQYLVSNRPLEPDPRCQETLDKLSKLHSNNTVITCYQKGIDSVECAQSFESQAVRKYRPGELDKLNLIEKLRDPLESPEVNARFTKMQAKLIEDIDKFKAEKSIENLRILDTSLFPVLATICSNDGLELTLDPVISDSAPTGTSTFVGSESIAESIRLLEQEFPKPNAKPSLAVTVAADLPKDTYFRSRILSDKCFDTIVDAVGIDNRLSSAICHRDGFISPSCLSALRRMQKLKELEGTTTSSSNIPTKKDGLASF